VGRIEDMKELPSATMLGMIPPLNIDDEIKRRQMEEGYSNDDYEDLTGYMEPYRNDYGDLNL